MLKSLGRAGILWDKRVITVHRYKRIIKLMWEWFLQFAHSEAEGTSLSLHLFWKHRGLFIFSRTLILPDFKWTFSCPGDERLILHRLVLWVVTQVCRKHPSVLPNLPCRTPLWQHFWLKYGHDLVFHSARQRRLRPGDRRHSNVAALSSVWHIYVFSILFL